VAELRNVIVFALGATRLATVVRGVRVGATLGFVTEVPTAPSGVAGVVNMHGTILPVLDLAVLHHGAAPVPARQGDGALVVEVDGVVAALRVDQVDEVATLSAAIDHVVDNRGRTLPLLDPREILRRAGEAVASIAGTGDDARGGH
jgi:chemotaxis signal transduction protein